MEWPAISSNMDFKKFFGVIDMIFIGDLSKSYFFVKDMEKDR